MSDKNRKKIFIALFVGVLVSCVSLGMLKKMQKQIKQQDEVIKMMSLQAENGSESYKYVVAQRDIAAGETVLAEDVATSVFDEMQDDGLATTDMAVGNVLIEPVKKGQVLTGYVFTGVNSPQNQSLPRKGYRALTLATDKLDGLSEEIKEGTSVDISSKSNKDDFMLQNIRILSLVSSDITQKKASSIIASKSVTFEIPSSELKNFINAYASGNLLLIQRPIGETSGIVTRSSKHFYSYSSDYYEKPTMPRLPRIEDINSLPPAASFSSVGQSVEVIEANTKSKVEFN